MGSIPMEAQFKPTARCSVHHSGVTILLRVCFTLSSLELFDYVRNSVRKKVIFTPNEYHYLPCTFSFIICIFVNVMAITFEVLRTCRGRVATATISVVMFGITVSEYPFFGKHM